MSTILLNNSSLVEPLIVTPALYQFRFFSDSENRVHWRIPDPVASWKWHSALELRNACQASIERQRCLTGDIGCPSWGFDFRDYITLNSNSGDEPQGLTWFIAQGQGYVADRRNPEHCPYEDPYLYFPAKFGLRVIKAIASGAKTIGWDRKSRSGAKSVLVGDHFHTGERLYLTEITRD